MLPESLLLVVIGLGVAAYFFASSMLFVGLPAPSLRLFAVPRLNSCPLQMPQDPSR
jgi:hypothetical protein